MEMGAGSPGEGVGRAGPEMELCVLAPGEGGRGTGGGEQGRGHEGPDHVLGLCRPAEEGGLTHQ